MTLMLHCGAEEVPYEHLRMVETPPATKSHVPIPHHRVVDLVRHTLSFYGHEVTEEHYGLTDDGLRFFGLLSLRSQYGDYEDTVGLRNSNDKKFPVGISFGSRVFVCDNLAFIGENTVMRRHTVNAVRDLPSLIMQIIEPLADQREAQHRCFTTYRNTPLTDAMADHGIMEMYRSGIINVQRIADVATQWETPDFDWGDRSAYRLFNAATHALEGRIAENPATAAQLHKLIDGICERVH
ncbi:DUF932 domain-containing protein [Zhengella mangrovi]|uniref:DUF932 domain-containing protein n=1 Tax=Zhengella mangrovi TaxID=1982044 RepID=A0A2G1QIQ5_9HYPH|nr:DUF932 domain-containing protein [Zhengella mangrovi]PHP65405.1 DUF932 domain-containing protein [Zhengella mangrovi]